MWNEFLRLLRRFFVGGGGEFAFPFGNKSVNTLERTPYNGQKPVNLRNYSDVQCSSVKFGVFWRYFSVWC